MGMLQMRKLRPEGFSGKPQSPASHFPNRRSIQSGESIPRSGRTGNQAAVSSGVLVQGASDCLTGLVLELHPVPINPCWCGLSFGVHPTSPPYPHG